MITKRPELMSEEEFKQYLEESINLLDYTCVGRFKSVIRAYKRGHISKNGFIYPRRPFHNKANTSKRKGVHSRRLNEYKKKIYGDIHKRLEARVQQGSGAVLQEMPLIENNESN